MKRRPSTRARDVLRILKGRRGFIAAGLALLGCGRSTRAQLVVPSPPIRYATLTRPVTIPVEAVTAPWRPVPFVAEALARPRATGITAAGARRVLISGVLFRRAIVAAGGAGPPGETEHAQLSALCVTCPHEQCQVDLVTNQERLARMIGQGDPHPLFECGCHFSVFDAAAGGARLSGESPRGLYQFRVAGIRDGMVEITEIEDVALFEV